jgi:superfamily I DNA/RNA helicase
VHTILESKISEYIKPNDFMIGRTNQQLIGIGLALVKENIRIYLEDKEIVTTLIKYIQSLKMTTVDEIKIYCMDLIEAYGQMNAIERAQYKYEIVENAIMSLSLINNFQNFSQSKSTNNLIAYIEDIINTTNPTDCVRIMSIHKSKGLEADNVFVLNEAEPFVKLARSKDMIQQEKNLSYVAITRAKNNLYLVKGVVE